MTSAGPSTPAATARALSRASSTERCSGSSVTTVDSSTPETTTSGSSPADLRVASRAGDWEARTTSGGHSRASEAEQRVEPDRARGRAPAGGTCAGRTPTPWRAFASSRARSHSRSPTLYDGA